MSDTEKLVTISRLKTLLDAYGVSPERWPEEERAAATALIETSAEAHILMEEAAALDRLLDRLPEPEVSAALTSRVRAIGQASTTPSPAKADAAQSGGFLTALQTLFRPQSPGAWQGAVAMAGILGIVAGVGLSLLVIDGAGQTQQTVSTATLAAVTPTRNTTELTVADGGTSDEIETSTASLAPDLNSLSLTGEDVGSTSATAAGSDAESQTDVGQFTVAGGVPLY